MRGGRRRAAAAAACFAVSAARRAPVARAAPDETGIPLALSDLFSRRRKHDPDAEVSAVDAPVYPTKALARFLANLGTHDGARLLDLGPVVGSNVNFFGEQLGCKILVEDLSKDIDRHVREERLADLPAFFKTRFPQASGSIDGILCWDLFDYLDKA